MKAEVMVIKQYSATVKCNNCVF